MELAWLIESRYTPGPSWWMGTSHPAPWTRDSLKAVRFCRKQDAEAAMVTLPEAHMCFVSEHQWGFGEEAAVTLGRKGGKKTGATKRRGDSAYYRDLAARSAARRRMCSHCWTEHGQHGPPNCAGVAHCGCHDADA